MRLRKRIERIRQSTKGVDPEVLDAILLAVGFSRRAGRGDHRIYSHPELDYKLSIDPRRPLLPVYVRQALKAIDEVFPDERG